MSKFATILHRMLKYVYLCNKTTTLKRQTKSRRKYEKNFSNYDSNGNNRHGIDRLRGG